MKLNGVMKALVWLGLGGGIGFFAGYRIGYSKDKKTMDITYGEIVRDAEAKVRKEYEAEIGKANDEIRKIREQAREALKAQREYLGAKDDEILDDADETVMEETPEMPEDPFPEENDGDTDGDEEIPQFHPEDLRPYGITVTAVQPGDIKTGFTAAREKSVEGDEAYGGRISKSVAKMEHDEQNGMDPAKAGAYIAKIALKDHPKPLYTIGFSYKAVCVLLKLLPCRLSNWLIGKLYA